MMNYTPFKQIRPLSLFEISTLFGELKDNNNLWSIHDKPEYTALRHGQTIWINNCTSNLKIVVDRFHLFPQTLQILQTISQNRTIGRCYWHKLMPGDQIERHHDRELTFVKNKQLESRCQIYFESKHQYCFESNDTRINMKSIENSIVKFDLLQPHYYKNESDTPWIFLVFDVLNIGGLRG